MSHRIERVGLGLLFLACLLLAAAAPAAAWTYTIGNGESFWFPELGEGLTIVGNVDEDQTLVLDVGAATDGPTTEAICPGIPDAELGHVPGVNLQRFRVHADFSQAVGVSLAVFFDDSSAKSWEPEWKRAPYTGTDGTGALVFTPPPYSNVRCLAYKLTFTLEDQNANGTVTVADIGIDLGEPVAPPDDGEDDGGRDGENDGIRKLGPGIADMGGNDNDSGSGGSGTGSGTSQGDGKSTGAGSGSGDGGASQAGEGESGANTDAPVGADPATSAGDMVTGYLVRASDLIAGVPGGVGGSMSAGAPDGGRSGASRLGLMWLAIALLFLASLAAAEVGQRLARRRLRTLVESTPDGPAYRTSEL